MIKALKKLQTIFYCIYRINWIKFFKLYNKNAKNVLWFYPFYREHFFTQSIEREFGAIYSFIKNNQPFKIVFSKKIGKIKDSNVFFFSTQHYNEHKFVNYTQILHYISKQLEEQNNKVYPTSGEALYWENKIYMHQKFKELNINQPNTVIIDRNTFNEESVIPLAFPFLIKEPHSCSSLGLYKVNNEEEFKQKIFGENQLLKKNGELILQELINMRSDMRITLVGDEICLHYWRINKQKEWRPTATGYGSDVDFISFPEKWRTHLINECKKFNLTSLGADITFDNNDQDSLPIFLEVSPFYQPNPAVDLTSINVPYGVYKKQFKLKNSWDIKFVDIIFELQDKIMIKYF